jgi:hypothetical protein
LRRGGFFVASKAERFEICQMMQAAQIPVRAARLLDMIDLETVGFAEFAVLRMRTRGRFMPAARAAIFVAPFHGLPRERPPVVPPKAVGAAIRAPHAAAAGQFGAAPAARTFGVRCKGTDLD